MSAASIADLLIRLRDEDKMERRHAALHLARSDDQRALVGLIEALSAERGEVRLLAAEALGCMTIPEAASALSVALQDEWDQVRRTAARSLEKIGDASALPALSEALDDTDPTTAAHAALALGKIGRPEAVPALLATLSRVARKRSTGDLDRACAFALSQIGQVIAGDNEAADRTVLVPALLAALGDEHHRVRIIAARLLGQLDDSRGVDFLIAALDDEDWQRRAEVAGALGECGSERAVESLIVLLRDDYESVRRAAATSLGRLGDPHAVQPLLAALGAAEQTTTRFPHGSLLGKINDPRDTQYAIALALQKILGEADAMGALVAVLADEAEAVTLLHKAQSWQRTLSSQRAVFRFGVKATSADHQPTQNLPRTVEEAVRCLVEELSLQDLLEIAQMPAELKVIANYHFGLGTDIRNRFGLFAGNNPALAEACGHSAIHPDDASSVILGALWTKLREAPQ